MVLSNSKGYFLVEVGITELKTLSRLLAYEVIDLGKKC